MTWRLATGEIVEDRPRSHLTEEARRLLPAALAKISGRTLGQDLNEVELDFGHTIGKSIRVETGPDDEIVFARRPGRDGPTRFVLNREPEPTSKMVVILKRARDGFVVITAWIGSKAEPEPWDRFATPRSKVFWSRNALVWGSVPVENPPQVCFKCGHSKRRHGIAGCDSCPCESREAETIDEYVKQSARLVVQVYERERSRLDARLERERRERDHELAIRTDNEIWLEELAAEIDQILGILRDSAAVIAERAVDSVAPNYSIDELSSVVDRFDFSDDASSTLSGLDLKRLRTLLTRENRDLLPESDLNDDYQVLGYHEELIVWLERQFESKAHKEAVWFNRFRTANFLIEEAESQFCETDFHDERFAPARAVAGLPRYKDYRETGSYDFYCLDCLKYVETSLTYNNYLAHDIIEVLEGGDLREP